MEKNLISISKKYIYHKSKLSKLVDSYLIPQEQHRKQNAEVSTPLKLRNEMLNKIPKKFWKKPRKVFEPCCGKGGFLMDIVDRFMKGLEKRYPDKKKRYQIIVEKCLYWGDINPTNVYICKLLLDPYSEYSLNYYTGDTLTLDIKEVWVLNGFNAIIGNPP